jgi:hypothetical protein
MQWCCQCHHGGAGGCLSWAAGCGLRAAGCGLRAAGCLQPAGRSGGGGGGINPVGFAWCWFGDWGARAVGSASPKNQDDQDQGRQQQQQAIRTPPRFRLCRTSHSGRWTRNNAQGGSPQFPGVLVGTPRVRKCHQMSSKEHIQLGWVLGRPLGP